VNAGARPWRLLIADDHQPTRDELRGTLDPDERFHICAVVADAAAAVQAAVRERPDVCLLDVRMPGGGVAAAWEIAARRPAAKIVMLTVSDGYLQKTMNLARLPAALVGVCAGEAAIQRTLVTRVLGRFRGREPRWRRVVGSGAAGPRLTSREWEVLELLAEQKSTAEIAERLALSASAVRVHTSSIVHNLEVRDRAAAVELFRRPRSGT
jgi:DNA-binding NarL/FixJ family response regulator